MSKRRRTSFWDYLAWGILMAMAVWVLLKIFGIINTPLWLQYAPIGGAIYLAGWAMKKLDTAGEDIKDIKREIKIIDKDVTSIKNNCPVFENN